MARQKCGCTPFVARILWTLASSQELSFFFWLSLGLSLDLRRVVSFVVFLGMHLVSRGLILPGIFVPAETWQDMSKKRFFFVLFFF